VRAVYRTSFERHRTLAPAARARLLAVDAARWGDAGRARSFPAPPGWRVGWATGSFIHPAHRGMLPGLRSGTAILACGRVDGRTVSVTADRTSGLRIWDMSRHRPLGEAFHGATRHIAAAVCATVDGRPVILTGGVDGAVRIWDVAARRQLGEPLQSRQATHIAGCAAIDVVESGGHSFVVVGYGSGQVRVWRLADRTEIRAFPDDFAEAVADLACTVVAGIAHVAVLYDDGTIRLSSLSDRVEVRAVRLGPGERRFASMVWLPGETGPLLAAGGWDGTVSLWDPVTLTERRRPEIRLPGTVDALAHSRVDGVPCLVLAGSRDPALHVCDLATGERLGPPLTGHMARVVQIVGTTIAGVPTAVSLDNDGEVRVWDLRECRPMGDPRIGHTAPVEAAGDHGALVYTTDGNRLLTWDLATGVPLETADGPGLIPVFQIAELGGRIMAVGGEPHGWVRVWRPGGGAESLAVYGYHERLQALAVGELAMPVVVTGGSEGDIVVRELLGGTELARWKGHEGGVTGAAVTRIATAAVIVTGGGDGEVR
ncbi:WD40 repeat domain-containing protein, partial [Actinocorallia lasiicapitis]